ncbi:MAG TPA: hypothetical protein VFU30_12005 [Gaiellaceae bacterium]|nr:hypothetical protein [Gaiellaceae bacterium]
MRYLLTALSVVVAALVLAAGAFSATGKILETEHAALHLEQIGPKYLTMERAEILQTEHAGLHLEQIGPRYLLGP